MGFLFKSRNERMLAGYQKIAQHVQKHREELSGLSEEDLRAQANKLKQRLETGEPFKNIVAAALALACVSAERTLGLSPYEVQVIGALTLLDGKIGEMRTGEGKTLTAALAAFVRSLEGKGVHVVTVNDYLTRRDSTTMAPIFELLGQSVGVVYPGMPDESKLSAYAADITYATNNEIGFDYLRDNMAVERAEQKQRGLHYAIVDEVDSILIDEARTPLIISGPHLEGPDVYQTVDAVAKQLVRSAEENGEGDYWADEKNKQVLLTESGMERAEVLLKEAGLLDVSDSLYAAHNITYIYHLNASLRAHSLYQKDIAYLVRDGEVQIVDEFTGRVMHGRRWGDGLHQALEVKEGVEIRPEQQTVASVTLQNLFRAYTHLAGMTGTADTEASEFMEIYGLEVVVIPTHRPMIRKDASDMVFLNMAGKLRRVVSDIAEFHQRQQPVLVGTASIEMSERLSDMLKAAGVPHNVLNAKQHEQEAKIVAEAGTLGAVTIATNMAGRGTDIVLGGSTEEISKWRFALKNTTDPLEQNQLREQIAQAEHSWNEHHAKVVELGGLHIIGTERHESRRIDNQLRGRAGRQGDPGSSQFYICFEDTLMKLFATDFAKRALSGLGMKEDDVINMPLISRQIERAQRSVEAHNFDIRKNLLDYDNVANEQRKVFYQWREEILSVSDVKQYAFEVLEDTLESLVEGAFAKNGFEGEGLWSDIEAQLVKLGVASSVIAAFDHSRLTTPAQTSSALIEHIQSWLDANHQQLGGAWLFNARALLLTAHDLHWREHLASLDTLRKGIHLRGFAQKQPKQEYKKEAFDLFRDMVSAARYDSTRGLFNMTQHMLNQQLALPENMSSSSQPPQRSMQYVQGNNWLRAPQSATQWNRDLSLAVVTNGWRQTLPSLQHIWAWRTV